jgi:hypothetical protein
MPIRQVFGPIAPDNILKQCSQINLVVGDLFKSNSSLLSESASADELITWLQSKSQLLRDQYQELRLGTTSVIRAVITQWTTHYLAY